VDGFWFGCFRSLSFFSALHQAADEYHEDRERSLAERNEKDERRLPEFGIISFVLFRSFRPSPTSVCGWPE
jgi:hypothetical protein